VDTMHPLLIARSSSVLFFMCNFLFANWKEQSCAPNVREMGWILLTILMGDLKLELCAGFAGITKIFVSQGIVHYKCLNKSANYLWFNSLVDLADCAKILPCRGKREILCGSCNGAGFLGGFLSTFDETAE